MKSRYRAHERTWPRGQHLHLFFMTCEASRPASALHARAPGCSGAPPQKSATSNRRSAARWARSARSLHTSRIVRAPDWSATWWPHGWRARLSKVTTQLARGAVVARYGHRLRVGRRVAPGALTTSASLWATSALRSSRARRERGRSAAKLAGAGGRIGTCSP
eukprot:4137677-Pyramimonas_sp.AAC.1